MSGSAPSLFWGRPLRPFKPTRIPQLPYELVKRIIQIGTDDYIYDERHDATISGHANYFLLRASLVTQTWRSIAQRLLLRHGLVDPVKALRFLYELDRKKLKETLVALRVGQLANGRDTSEAEARNNSVAVSYLLRSLPTLKSLEFVGERLRLSSGEFGIGLHSPAPNGILKLAFTGQSLDHGVFGALDEAFRPRELTIIESAAGAGWRVPPEIHERVPWVGLLFSEVEDLQIVSTNLLGVPYRGLLRAFELNVELGFSKVHLEYRKPAGIVDALSFFAAADWALFRSSTLATLVIPLALLQALVEFQRLPPTLVSLEIMANPTSKVDAISMLYLVEIKTAPRTLLLDVLYDSSTLGALKRLSLLTEWRCGTMEEVCEKRGIDLIWK